MIGFLDGLRLTLKTALRKPVTDQYPDPAQRHQVAPRYIGFPALRTGGSAPERARPPLVKTAVAEPMGER